jgi:hypothetical protein
MYSTNLVLVVLVPQTFSLHRMHMYMTILVVRYTYGRQAKSFARHAQGGPAKSGFVL